MSVYRRKNYDFNRVLCQRAEEFSGRTAVTRCAKTGRIVVLELPYLTFSTEGDAVRFLRRVTSARWRS